ncbi:uncharacterized protein [Diabrotica undecimpunctata]|uniref:uncharacterized protein n=1 Tax=Diabrotica undecimpunctata TaxID=50387 RepID=UPI003B634E28
MKIKMRILILASLVTVCVANPRLFGEDGALKKAAERLHEKNQKIAADTSKALQNARENIKNTNEKIASQTAEALEKAKEDLKNTGETISRKTNEAVANAKENLQNAGENIHNAGEKFADNTSNALQKAKQDIHETGERIKDKAVKIAKGEEPIVDVKVNSRVKVLHSEVGVQGQLTIGGHRTGFHGSADANILGQKANVHADLLNIHKNPNDTHHQHESAIKKLKELINKNKNQNAEVNGEQYIENEYPSGGQNVYYIPEEQNYPQYRELYQPNVVSDVQNVANDRGSPVYIPTENAQDLTDYYKYGAPGSRTMYVDNEGRYVREDTFWQQEDNYKTNPKYLAAVEDGDYSGLIDVRYK